jgi:DNA-binding NarL/FixJ family response regulator
MESMMERISVLLADDHALFRDGLISLLSTQEDIEVVGEAADGEEAVEKARELVPDLILMDIKMPRCNGLEATRLIKEEMPHVRIVMLTVSEDDQDLFEAIKNGAEGYLLKTLNAQELVDNLKGVFRGEAPISRTMARKILAEFASQARRQEQTGMPQSNLTRREIEVLRLVSEGATDKEIAARLSISLRTVKNHNHNILEKLHLQNRVQAAAYALRQGLIQQPPSEEA